VAARAIHGRATNKRDFSAPPIAEGGTARKLNHAPGTRPTVPLGPVASTGLNDDVTTGPTGRVHARAGADRDRMALLSDDVVVGRGDLNGSSRYELGPVALDV
jgi:hypothetical protein